MVVDEDNNRADLAALAKEQREREEQKAVTDAGRGEQPEGFLGFIFAIFQVISELTGQGKSWWSPREEPSDYVNMSSQNTGNEKSFWQKQEEPSNYVEMKSVHGWRDRAIHTILIDYEGGGKVHFDNDGGKTSYGMNENYNDLDADTLTYQDAANNMLDKYWIKEAGKYGRGFEFYVSDTALNMGKGTAQKWIEESGGDLNKFIELREAKYRRLDASGKEKYQGYLDGWLKRSGKAEIYARELMAQDLMLAQALENGAAEPRQSNESQDVTLASIEQAGAGKTPHDGSEAASRDITG